MGLPAAVKSAAELLPRIRRLRAPNPSIMTGPGTNTYLVEGSQYVAVIDPGPVISEHLSNLTRELGALNKPALVLLTHRHEDHAPLALALAKMVDAKVFAGEEHEGVEVLKDGMKLDLGETVLVALHTAGHSPDHFCFYHPETASVFTGDHVMQGSTVVVIPPDGNMKAYIDNLERLKKLSPLRYLLPGHGDVIDEPVRELDQLIAHRLMREQKVLNALSKAGEARIAELVPAVYDDVPKERWTVASLSLWAHLRKLAEEGRAECSSADERTGTWRIR